MVITQLLGGLGNQMFQYAAGRALSLRRGCEYALDISSFETYKPHQGFELQRVFNHSFALASKLDIRRILWWQSSRRIRGIVTRPVLEFLRSPHLVVEPHFHVWPGIQDVVPPCYLVGYWQSEHYFSDVKETIRSDFTFSESLSYKNLGLAKEIGAVNAVSLHIRRGDYVQNSKALAVHGLCPLEYYGAAVQYISKRVEAPCFFVFSDDIDWARANLKMSQPCCYVDYNHGAESYNDMRLMSLCRHHIIANSSFSWWGAWLNSRADKIVIAPKQWFRSNTDTSDLLPQSWVKL